MEKFDSFYGTVPVQWLGETRSGYGHGPGRRPETVMDGYRPDGNVTGMTGIMVIIINKEYNSAEHIYVYWK